jgi:hypothetical protein
VRSDRAGKRGTDRDLLADVRRADLAEPQAAVRLGDLQPQQVEIGRLAQQRPDERPVVREQPALVRQHLVAHELGGGLPEHPLFLGQLLAREDVRRSHGRRQEPAAGYGLRLGHPITMSFERSAFVERTTNGRIDSMWSESAV